jgi:hypothetical protein
VLAKHIGIIGVALGTTIPLTIMAFGVYLPYACRVIELPYRRLLGRLALPVAVNAVAYGILRLTAGSQHLFSNLIVLLAASAGVFAVCFGASFLLDSHERSTYVDMLRQLATRQRS